MGSKIPGLRMRGFPGGSVVKNPPANAGDPGSIPGSGRSSRRKWQQEEIFRILAWKSHEQCSLMGYGPWGRKRVRHWLNNGNTEWGLQWWGNRDSLRTWHPNTLTVQTHISALLLKAYLRLPASDPHEISSEDSDLDVFNELYMSLHIKYHHRVNQRTVTGKVALSACPCP